MTRAAIAVLSRNPDGFVLMVEAGLIDKYNHPLDWERSVYDTIMLSNAVQVAKDWAAARNDTLIIVTPDHTHGVSIVGTVDDAKPGPEMRDKVGVYSDAGFPNYPAAEFQRISGARRRVATARDVLRQLSRLLRDVPAQARRPVRAERAHRQELRRQSAIQGPSGCELRTGNLPRSADTGTHTVDDGVLTAMGPGSEEFHGFMENVEVFRVMVNALGLGKP